MLTVPAFTVVRYAHSSSLKSMTAWTCLSTGALYTSEVRRTRVDDFSTGNRVVWDEVRRLLTTLGHVFAAGSHVAIWECPLREVWGKGSKVSGCYRGNAECRSHESPHAEMLLQPNMGALVSLCLYFGLANLGLLGWLYFRARHPHPWGRGRDARPSYHA